MQTAPVEISVNGQIVAVPAAVVNARTVIVTGRWLRVATLEDEEWLEGETVGDPEQFLATLRQTGLGADLFTFAQKLSEPDPRYQYPLEWDNVAAIPTTQYAVWWDGLSQETRRNVRRAEKRGVQVRSVGFDDEFVAGIKGIYDETPIRQGRHFWHYGKELAAVRRENATYRERSEFIGAYFGTELIGFIKMVYVDDAASIMQILSKNAHYDKRPANALIAKAVEICANRGLRYLTYCKYTYDKKADSPITEFKRRNGFVEIRFPRYYIPLTLKGRLAVKCGLHCGIKNLLPAWLTNFLLETRAWCYQKFVLKKEIAAADTGAQNS